MFVQTAHPCVQGLDFPTTTATTGWTLREISMLILFALIPPTPIPFVFLDLYGCTKIQTILALYKHLYMYIRCT